MKIAILAIIALVFSASTASAEVVSIGSFIINALMSLGAGSLLPAISAATVGTIVLRGRKSR